MPYADVPAFVAELRQRPATALEFCILTPARCHRWLASFQNEAACRGFRARNDLTQRV
jgi:hypothetical protein